MNTNDSEKDLITKLFFLGGLEEVGKNCYCLEHKDEILMIDCGIKMPSDEDFGCSKIIPDFSYIKKNNDRFKALLITHAHEDHIGAIPYLLRQIDVPVIYAPRFAQQLIERKLKEHKLKNKVKFITIDSNSEVNTKHFNIKFFNTVHSVPDTLGMIFTTDNGTIVTSADFRFDLRPFGKITEFSKLTELGKKKQCDVFISDSTNSLVPGFSYSEYEILKNLERILIEAKGRIIISTFASNINRIQKIVELATKHNRKLVTFGTSMNRGLDASLKLGYLKIDNSKKVIVNPKKMHEVPKDNLLILCTGSQGEDLSALRRMSQGRHPQIKVTKGDTVVFSSKPIPGNFLSVQITINKLIKLGAKVIVNTKDFAIHNSGHATQNEQRLFFALLKPAFFVPMHGEYNMLVEHCETAASMGIDKDRSFILKNGDVVGLYKRQLFQMEPVESGACFIDGYGYLFTDNKSVETRSKFANDGLITIIAALDKTGKKQISAPLIISRGTFFVKANAKLIFQMQAIVKKFIDEYLQKGRAINFLEDEIRVIVTDFIFKRKKRQPFVSLITLNKND